MAIIKIIKDNLLKGLGGSPKGLLDVQEYFKVFGPISFKFQQADGLIIATSENYHYGSIVTSGKNLIELDKNIKDAILTAFEVPSAYAAVAKITRVGEGQEYVLV